MDYYPRIQRIVDLQKNATTTQMKTGKVSGESGSLDLVLKKTIHLLKKEPKTRRHAVNFIFCKLHFCTPKKHHPKPHQKHHKTGDTHFLSMTVSSPSTPGLPCRAPDSFLQKLPVAWGATNALSQHLGCFSCRSWSFRL